MKSKFFYPIGLSLILLLIGVFNQWYYLVPGILVTLFYFLNRTKHLPFLFNSLLISLIILETILRTIDIIPTSYRSFEQLNQKHFKYADIHCLKPNSSVEMTEIGDLGAMLGNEDFQIKKEISTTVDELGYRNIPDQKKQLNKVVLLGDSYALGIGLSQDETISSLLKVESYNLGFPGGVGDATKRYMCFRDEIKTSKEHKVILLFFEGNDFHDMFLSEFKPDKLNLQERITNNYLRFRKRSAIRQIYTRILYTDFDQNKKHQVYRKDSTLFYGNYSESLLSNDFNEIAAHENFNFLKDLVVEKDGQLEVIIIPSKTSYRKDDIKRDKLKRLLEEVKIPFIDMNNEFMKRKAKIEDLWWRDDTHFSPYGSMITAEVIKKTL